MNQKDYVFDYYENIVKPTVQEFIENKHDIRKGRIAAIVLDHMRDYWAIYLDQHEKWSITETILKDEIYELCPDAALIRDVCNATKHGLLRISTNDKNIPKSIHSTHQIKSEQNEGLFVGGFGSMFGESNYVYINFEHENEVNNKSLKQRFLFEVVSVVRDYWEKKLDSEKNALLFRDEK